MHYCESGTISGVISSAKKNKSNLAESQIVKWVLQLALAMQYLHDNHVVHRDLKPMNVMLTGKVLRCLFFFVRNFIEVCTLTMGQSQAYYFINELMFLAFKVQPLLVSSLHHYRGWRQSKTRGFRTGDEYVGKIRGRKYRRGECLLCDLILCNVIFGVCALQPVRYFSVPDTACVLNVWKSCL